MFSKIIEFLSGKKAYIIGIITVILGILQKDQTVIFQGRGISTLRAGIAKMTK